MTSIKISMFALAFVLATGAAFATSSKTTEPCVKDPRTNEVCDPTPPEECCIFDSVTYPGSLL